MKTKKNKEIKIDQNISSFSYSAKVSVSLMKNNKKYFTETYTNHGRWPLFYFLNLALMGDYNKAEVLRPKLVRVFDFKQTGNPVPDIKDNGSETIGEYFNKTNQISLVAWPYESIPDVSYEQKDQIGTSEVTYKFTIPFTQINLNPNHQAIEGFALYPNADISIIENPSIYLFLSDDEGKVKNLLSLLNPNQLGNEYNLYIEWTLKITNPE